MKDSIDITLEYPVSAPGTATTTVVHVRRPSVLDILTVQEISDDGGEQTLARIANLCELTPETVKQIDLKDFDKIDEAINELTDFEPVEGYHPGDEIVLGKPITIREKTIERVRLRRPKIGDVYESRKTESSDARRELRIFCLISGLTFEEITAMDYADMQRIKSIYADFLV